MQSHCSPVSLLSDLTRGFWLLMNFEGMLSWYEVFCNRVVKGISDHFIMQIKLFYCNRNLTLQWQSERKGVGMIVFNDTE